MEAAEAAERVREAVEEERHLFAEERAEHERRESLRTRVALMISALAVLLAVAAQQGQEVTVEIINSNTEVNDKWAFFQAKNIRRTSTMLAKDQLQLALAAPGISASERQQAETRIQEYDKAIAEYTSRRDPKHPDDVLKGEGLDELYERATHAEQVREHLMARLPNYHYAETVFQIAIVLGSVAIVANSRRVVMLCLVLGVIGLLFMGNGWLSIVELPHGQAH